MSEAFEPGPAASERLSALMDGELDPHDVAQACRGWSDTAGARATWHAYQLIGDVLRSTDLAADPAHDAAFLHAVRGRLACEPVVLAPQPVVAPARPAAALARRRGWVVGSAVAAGCAAVLAVVVVGRAPGSAPAGLRDPELARRDAAPVGAVASRQPALPAPPGSLVRDPQLDRYLEAHQEFAGSSALGVPSAFLRSATLVQDGGR